MAGLAGLELLFLADWQIVQVISNGVDGMIRGKIFH